MSSGPGQVVVVGRAQEAEAVRQRLEHALREDAARSSRRAPSGSRRSAPACACRSRPARRAAWRSCVSRVDAHVLERGELDDGGFGSGGGAGGLGHPRGCTSLAILAISFHSSSSPSPLAAETGSGGHSKHVLDGPQAARPLGARQLVDLGGDDVPRDVQPIQPARGGDVGLEPGCRASTSSIAARLTPGSAARKYPSAIDRSSSASSTPPRASTAHAP